MDNKKSALLVMQDGTIMPGISVGVNGIALGEMVFNTAMTGYQEIITDPSYASQIILFTYPHIGNTGVNGYDNESERVWASGIVLRDFESDGSNYRTEKSFKSFLLDNEVVAIADVDTRSLTKHIRKYGCLNSCIMCTDEIDVAQALHLVKTWKRNSSEEIIDLVTSKSIRKIGKGRSPSSLFYHSGLVRNDTDSSNLTKEINIHNRQKMGKSTIDGITNDSSSSNKKYKILVYDFGVKNSILNSLVDIGFEVLLVPAFTDISVIKQHNPDGIVFSNGPGDPRECPNLIAKVKEVMDLDIPILGICLGHQLLSLAYGAEIFKMKFGHHGANHPVKNLIDKTFSISSQNHNYAVVSSSLPKEINIIASSLFDNTIQALENPKYNSISFQGHPEAGPGPRDCYFIFKYFLQKIKNQ